MKKINFQTVKKTAVIVAIIAVLLIGKKVLDFFGVTTSGKHSTGNVKIIELNNTIANVAESVNSSNLTITKTTAFDLANRLHQAMKGFGTNEVEIQTILSNKTLDDLKLIYACFGQKEYRDVLEFSMMDLKGWLFKELGTELWALQKMLMDAVKI